MPGAIETMMDAAVKYDADIVEGSYKTFYNNEEHDGCRHEYTVTDQWQGKLFGIHSRIL